MSSRDLVRVVTEPLGSAERPVVRVIFDADDRWDDLMLIAWPWGNSCSMAVTVTVVGKGLYRQSIIPLAHENFEFLASGEFDIHIVQRGRVIETRANASTTTQATPVEFRKAWQEIRQGMTCRVECSSPWVALAEVDSFDAHHDDYQKLSKGWGQRILMDISRIRQWLNDVVPLPEDWTCSIKAPTPWQLTLLQWARQLEPTVDGLLTSMKGVKDLTPQQVGESWFQLVEVNNALPQTEMNARQLALMACFDLNVFWGHLSNEGTVFPWINPLSGMAESLHLQPENFPDGCDASAYWRNVRSLLPINLGNMISGGDYPVSLSWGNSEAEEARPSPPLPTVQSIEEVFAATDALLHEAATDKQWSVPPSAVVQLQVGPYSKMSIMEVGTDYYFVLRDEHERFALAVLNPVKGFFNYEGSFPGLTVGGDPEECMKAEAALELVLASVVRDFVVVEEREGVFDSMALPGTRKGPSTRMPTGPRIVYLPRVKYTPNPDVRKCAETLNLAERRAHQVSAHLRKARTSSGEQRLLALRYGFSVPEGYTFVRPHERGGKVREVLYRSRSALRCLYTSVDSRPSGKSKWFQFERDVRAMLLGAGFDAQHTAVARNGDQGVDVYATKGHDLEQVQWVIQCKCYGPKRKVPVSAVRELIGALEPYQRGTKGMLVTTSDFTRDARKLAEKSGIRLMNGWEFSKRASDDRPAT